MVKVDVSLMEGRSLADKHALQRPVRNSATAYYVGHSLMHCSADQERNEGASATALLAKMSVSIRSKIQQKGPRISYTFLYGSLGDTLMHVAA